MDTTNKYTRIIISNESNIEEPKKHSLTQTGVSVITCTCHIGTIDLVFDNFLRQNYENKELIIILNNNHMDISQYNQKASLYENIKIFQLDEKATLGDCFKLGLQYANFEYIAKFDDDDYYGCNYLKQAINTFNHIDCDIVGKAVFFVYFLGSKTLATCGIKKENRFVKHVADSTLVFKRKVLDNIVIPSIKGPGTFVKMQIQCAENGYSIYSTDRFNYLVNRNINPEEEHTWKVSESTFLKYRTVKIVEQNIDNYIPYIEP